MDVGWTLGICVVRMRSTGRKTSVNAWSRSRVRTDGRTIVLGRVRSSKKRLASYASNLPSTSRDCRSYRTVRPSVRTRDLDRAFTNVLRPVVRMRTTQVPHRQASTPRPPHVMFLTRPSPRLANHCSEPLSSFFNYYTSSNRL